jgi:queuine tRNA-ribosyltransferase
MIEFKVLKKSKKSWARLGLLKTPHGVVETPALVPVATKAVIKTLTSEEVKATNTQLTISNTFHLHLKPGDKIVKRAGGINEFMKADWPTMTDSGGFQVFSLGFGHDMQVGKLLKYFPGKSKEMSVEMGNKPKSVKITEEGVHFRSPFDGSKLFIGPKESIKFQENIGADIIYAFDECTPPLSTIDYAAKSLELTHRWAKICVDSKKTDQALYGIVQGSRYQPLREKASKFIDSLDVAGYGIGGDLGESRQTMDDILSWVIPNLQDGRPRHMLGIGYLEDMEIIIKRGIDTFDCTVPTHFARRGIAFTSKGKLDLKKTRFLTDKNPIDKNCLCNTCQTYKRNYICHLFKGDEITAMRLVTFHNLFYFNKVVADIRQKIKDGKI